MNLSRTLAKLATVLLPLSALTTFAATPTISDLNPAAIYITVPSGTWWVGTGDKYDPPSTVPIPTGSFVVHTGKETHYDGAKEGTGDAVLQILGMGPATSVPAEKK